MNPLAISFMRTDPRATLPRYATDGSGCFDLFAVTDVLVRVDHPVIVDTGLAFEIPEGYVMLIFSRSGMGFKHDVRLSNCVGVIDSDYRGSVQVKLTRDTAYGATHISNEKAIAQALVLPRPLIEFYEVERLNETARSTAGFGSTDKQ